MMWQVVLLTTLLAHVTLASPVHKDITANQHHDAHKPNPITREQLSHSEDNYLLESDPQAASLSEEEMYFEGMFKAENASGLMAFTVELEQDTNVVEGGTIVFDKVLVNEGEAYFKDVGVFFCNSEDLYAFIWTLHSPTEYRGLEQGKARLFRGSEEIKYGPFTSVLHSYSGGVIEENQGTSMMATVAYCKEGVGFRLVAGRYSFSQTVSTYSARNTSFSGFRIASANDRDKVAFAAELSQNTTVPPGYTIIFDDQKLNTSNDYNPMFGYFRCPDNDTYSFSWSLEASDMTKAAAVLVQEGTILAYGPSTYRGFNNPPTPSSGTSTSSIIVQCTQDDRIYVRSEEPDVSENPYIELDAQLTSFSGYRIGGAVNTIAFTAQLTQNQQVVERSTIMYDNVLLNLGGFYFPTIGTFICPNDKFFLFTWTVKLSGYYAAYTHLIKSGEEVKVGPATAYINSPEQLSGGTTSMSTVVQCTTNAAISVRFVYRLIPTMDYFLQANYNYFSGFQLPEQ